MTKRFRFKADTTFMAEDIDDAFEKIAEHFMAMAGCIAIDTGGKPQELQHIGTMEIGPVADGSIVDLKPDERIEYDGKGGYHIVKDPNK